MSRAANAALAPAVLIGASSGGIEALRRVLPALTPDFPASVIIVLHTASQTAEGLCRLLQHSGALPVQEAQQHEPARAGQVYLAPPGYHLLIERDGCFALSVDEKVCFVRPSADVLFECAADVWGARAVGVVLSGANDDGARGLAALRRRGAVAIVQSPEEAAFRAMPDAALAVAGADHVLPLDAIGTALNRLAAGLARRVNSVV